MKTRQLFTVALAAILSLGTTTLLAQSKEQREAAKAHPLSLRVNPGKNDSKQIKPTGANGGKGQSETTEKIYRWTAQVAKSSTNETGKVELKIHYVGQHNGEFAIINSATLPVEFSDKGRATVEIVSPTFRLTKTETRKGGGRNASVEKSVEGDRLNGVIVQLIADGTIVKVFSSQPAWAKGAWEPELSEQHLKPGARK